MTDQLPLANLITLGASDFGALRDFYRGVGWPQVMDDVHNRRHRNGPPLFLRPLAHSDPAIGPLTFHFSAGGHSFDDLAATVDAAPLAHAASQAVELWPPTPGPDFPPRTAPKPVAPPANSWFEK